MKKHSVLTVDKQLEQIESKWNRSASFKKVLYRTTALSKDIVFMVFAILFLSFFLGRTCFTYVAFIGGAVCVFAFCLYFACYILHQLYFGSKLKTTIVKLEPRNWSDVRSKDIEEK